MSQIKSKTKVSDVWIPSPYAVMVLIAVALAVGVSGCISDQGSFNQLSFTGYVRSASDSSAIPGAGVITDCFSYQDPSSNLAYCDSNGYYEEKFSIPVGALSGQTDVRVWLVVVFDADGDIHGVFLPRDTLLNEYDPMTVLETHFDVDFYVEME